MHTSFPFICTQYNREMCPFCDKNMRILLKKVFYLYLIPAPACSQYS